MGGSLVRDLYKWHETATGSGSKLKRSKSQNDARSSRGPSRENSGRTRPPDLRKPGGFRRHYLHSRAKRDGREPPTTTSSFLDFLYVQGKFSDEYPPVLDEDILKLPYLAPKSASLDPYGEKPDEAIMGAAPNAHQISASKAALMLIKGFIGTGVLFLPKAFANGGFLFSIAMLLFMGFINLLAMLLLVECRDKVRGGFGDIAGAVFGPRMRIMVKTSIIIMQLGMCCCYVIFVGKIAQHVISVLSQGSVNWPLWMLILLELMFYVPMSWIRMINKLSGMVMLANIFVVLGLGYVAINSFTFMANNGLAEEFRSMRPYAVYINPFDFTLFIGVAVFSFEGIGLVLPIVEAMKEPEKFSSTLKISVTIVTIVFAAIGTLCYMAFGGDTQELAFENFAPGDHVGIAIQILYAFAVMLSVPLAMFPAIRIMETAIFAPSEATTPVDGNLSKSQPILSNFSGSGRTSANVKWMKNLLRMFICFLTVAVAIPGSADFEKFVGLVGAFACVPLMFMYPAAFHYMAVAKTRRERMLDIFLIVFGGVSMVFVSVMTIHSWIKEASMISH